MNYEAADAICEVILDKIRIVTKDEKEIRLRIDYPEDDEHKLIYSVLNSASSAISKPVKFSIPVFKYIKYRSYFPNFKWSIGRSNCKASSILSVIYEELQQQIYEHFENGLGEIYKEYYGKENE